MVNLNLFDEDYKWATEEICKVADKFTDDRVISMLEGGYDLASLRRVSAEHVALMLGEQDTK